MSRPHEDHQRHTATDHHAGGQAIVFAPGAWWAIAVVHVTAERADAAIASYDTLVEKARTSAARAHEAAILRSQNHRRVIVLLHLDGHEGFRHLGAAWDDHHLVAPRHDVAESRSLTLYRLVANLGDAAIDPASTDALAFEQFSDDLERMQAVTSSIAAAPGFRGASTLRSDDDTTAAIIYRFANVEEIGAFRASETLYPVHVVRTFV
ncbi:MAG: hypothetical protein WBX26_11920 [Candidatus Cybelea sp.]